MALTITIPDKIAETIKIPRQHVKKELIKELAFLLYERELASMGICRNLSEMTKWEFIEGLAERGIKRHYHEKEFKEDMAYAKRRK